MLNSITLINVFAVTFGGGQMHEFPKAPGSGLQVFVSPAKVLPAGNQSGDPVLPALDFTPLMVMGFEAETWQVCVV